jgi:hypothetical protein
MQLALVKGLLQVFEEEAPEQTGQHADGQEEARTTGDPTLAIWADARRPARQNADLLVGFR